MSRWIRPLIVALTLTALLGVPGISAADSSLGSLWGFMAGTWLKAGCMIDPWGHCMTGSTPASQDEGCRIDPNGRCVTRPPVTADAGCMIDPDGRCKPGS
ncbi:MAG TPA: hypothetical protein VGH73_16710 [Thermoanaerobaculia bacterium]|jgi:hypothetical protein